MNSLRNTAVRWGPFIVYYIRLPCLMQGPANGQIYEVIINSSSLCKQPTSYKFHASKTASKVKQRAGGEGCTQVLNHTPVYNKFVAVCPMHMFHFAFFNWDVNFVTAFLYPSTTLVSLSIHTDLSGKTWDYHVIKKISFLIWNKPTTVLNQVMIALVQLQCIFSYTVLANQLEPQAPNT